MTTEEILKLIDLLIGKRSPHGEHGIDMDVIRPNISILGEVTAELISQLQRIATNYEGRVELSIQACGKEARYWIEFIKDEVLEESK